MDGKLKHKDVEAEEVEKKRLLDACRAVSNYHNRTFVQGESRSQVYWDYAEPQPKVHLYERNSSKYRVDAKRMYREYTRLSVQRVVQPSGTLLRSVSNTCA